MLDIVGAIGTTARRERKQQQQNKQTNKQTKRNRVRAYGIRHLYFDEHNICGIPRRHLWSPSL